MPKIITHSEFEPLIKAVAAFPDGATIDALSQIPELMNSRRTLQRQLALLVELGKLTTEGQARARRYWVATEQPTTSASIVAEGSTPWQSGAEISLSTEGSGILQNVRWPLHQRQPVGYNRAFLDDYRPNQSFYLPEETRAHLRSLGKPVGTELPAGTYARKIFDRLLIDLSWNSSRLEGNTYSLLETERLLELGQSAEGRDAREAQMILNHKAAIELLVDQADEIGFNKYTICNLHALLADNLLADPQAPGRLRAMPVGIGGTTYHPLEVPQLIEECFQQILDTAEAITDPFEQAFFAMVHLPYLQPFEDVNKRVSRLAANIPLIRQNLSPLSFVDVPEQLYISGLLGIYELNQIALMRDVFVWAYQRSCLRYAAVRQSLGEPDPFRMRYRTVLINAIGHIVRTGLDKVTAAAFIKQFAIENIPDSDRARFVEVAETELLSLHEGSIARYRLRPSEYEVWQRVWRS